MKDAFAYCEALVRESDKDRFLATLFAGAEHRPALFALYAFNIEIGRVAAAVTQPLAGEIRLQWWTEVIEDKRTDEAAANPVASALRGVIARYRLPVNLLLDVIEASRADLYELDDIEPNIQAAAAVVELAARILCDGLDPEIAELARHAGIALASADNARALRHLTEAGALVSAAPPAVLPALLPLVLVRPMRTGKALPPWRRQWLIWRAGRNPARICR